MKKDKQFPAINSDDELEKLVTQSDLSEYDLSDLKPISFEFQPKDTSITLRMSRQLLDAVKDKAAKQNIPYQRYMRMLIEEATL